MPTHGPQAGLEHAQAGRERSRRVPLARDLVEDLARAGSGGRRDEALGNALAAERLISATATPGSRQILDQITRSGTYVDLLTAGVRCSTCLPPMRGHGQAPPRVGLVADVQPEFPGRSGTANNQVYLCSPAVAAASMLTGVISDRRTCRRSGCRSARGSAGGGAEEHP